MRMCNSALRHLWRAVRDEPCAHSHTFTQWQRCLLRCWSSRRREPFSRAPEQRPSSVLSPEHPLCMLLCAGNPRACGLSERCERAGRLSLEHGRPQRRRHQ